MTLDELTKMVVNFRDERKWKKYHRPKDLAISLMLESAELLDHFRFKSDNEIKKYLKNSKNRGVAEELADVLHNVLLIADELKIDLVKVFVEKMKKNEKKYPI
jgi:NTP pyrophosphatase (non-canonical NTP hydrolase)